MSQIKNKQKTTATLRTTKNAKKEQNKKKRQRIKLEKKAFKKFKKTILT